MVLNYKGRHVNDNWTGINYLPYVQSRWGLHTPSMLRAGYPSLLPTGFFFSRLIFGSLEPKAYWWGYRIGRPPSSVVCLSSTLFKNVFLRNHWADWSQISYEVSTGGSKVYSNGPGHMTKMAAMPVYGKIFFSWTRRPMTLKLGMLHRVFEYYQIYSNYELGLTLTYFTARSNLVPYAFVWEKGWLQNFVPKGLYAPCPGDIYMY